MEEQKSFDKYDKYTEDLVKFLKEILKLTDFKNDYLLIESKIKDWKKCFTHETFSPFPNENNKVFIEIGSYSLKSNLSIYINKKYSNLDGETLHKIVENLSSNSVLISFVESLKLVNYLRHNLKKESFYDYLYIETFIAFIGCINVVGNKIREGLGLFISYNFIIKIYDQVEENIEILKESNEERVNRIFSNMNFGKLDIVFVNNKLETIIYPSKEFKDYILEQGVLDENLENLSFKGKGSDYYSSVEEAYGKILKYLESLSIEVDSSEIREEYDESILELISKVEEIAKNKGYSEIFLTKPKISSKIYGFYYVHLIGIQKIKKYKSRKDTKSFKFLKKAEVNRKVLNTYIDTLNSKKIDLYRNVLEDYIKKSKKLLISHQRYFNKISKEEHRADIFENLIKSSNIKLKNIKYLDVGCGDGLITNEIIKRFNIKEHYCADIIENNREDFIKIENNKIPLKDNSINLMSSLMSIHHFKNIIKMIKEMSRVMKDNGILFIREHDANTKILPYLDVVHMVYNILENKKYEVFLEKYISHYLSKESLYKILKNYGFKFLKEDDTYNIVKNKQRIYHSIFIKEKLEITKEYSEEIYVKENKFSIKNGNLLKYIKSDKDSRDYISKKILVKSKNNNINEILTYSVDDKSLYDNLLNSILTKK